MTSAARDVFASSAPSARTQSARWFIGKGAPPGVRLCRSLRAKVEHHGHLGEMSLPIYGDAVAAGAGVGDPKLKFTVGALSAPCCAAKNGRGWKPNIPAIKFVGKRRTAVL